MYPLNVKSLTYEIVWLLSSTCMRVDDKCPEFYQCILKVLIFADTKRKAWTFGNNHEEVVSKLAMVKPFLFHITLIKKKPYNAEALDTSYSYYVPFLNFSVKVFAYETFM
ncbi:hypothetical protein QQ045_033452 [Rhodiola kirilowii]